MFLKNVSFGPPFDISIEFRQKSLKNFFFFEKKLKQNFGDLTKNCPLNPMSLPPPSPSPSLPLPLPPRIFFLIFRFSLPLT
jgi:hypothetical protein